MSIIDKNVFNYYEYINNYEDLIWFNQYQAYRHYLSYGINEGRVFNTNNLSNFNPSIYKNLYDDIRHMTDDEATMHYIRYGKF